MIFAIFVAEILKQGVDIAIAQSPHQVEDRISLMDHAKIRRGVSHSECNTNGPPVSGEPNTNIRKLITETIPPLLYRCLSSRQTIRTPNAAQLHEFERETSDSFVRSNILVS